MPDDAASGVRPRYDLNQHAAEPLYRQLYERLRAEILSGQLRVGARLPSTRQLASDLGVSRNTTALAYELLQLEGYVTSRVGDGTRVAPLEDEPRPAKAMRQGRAAGAELGSARLSQRGATLAQLAETAEFGAPRGGGMPGAFRVGHPDASAFPYDIWARLIARRARSALPGQGTSAQGALELRAAIAAHIGITRGVPCAPDQIMLTSGSQGALDLLGRVLLDVGDAAWVEDPGYLGARGALLGAGAQLVPVPVDGEGIDVAAGRTLCPNARLAVVTPSHQFPTAVTTSLRRRLALLEWSRERGAWIVEDDYDSEFRYSGRPLEALHGLDQDGRVLYVGTFSKVLFPALRLGYVVAPQALMPALVAMRRFVDGHLPLLDQLALADFIAEGHFSRHLRRMRLRYLQRRDALVAALHTELGAVLDVVVPEAGLHLVAWLPAGMAAAPIVAQAAALGLQLQPVASSSLRRLPRDGLVLGFAQGTPPELRAAVRTLGTVLRAQGNAS